MNESIDLNILEAESAEEYHAKACDARGCTTRRPLD